MNTKMFSEILLRRRNKLNILPNITAENNAAYVMCLMKNLNEVGYTLSIDLVKVMSTMTKETLGDLYKELMSCLKEYVGANRTYNVMYENFPMCMTDGSISDLELLVNAFIAYLTDCRYLPEYEKEERLPLFESTDLKVIDLGTNEELNEILNNLVSAKTSLSAQDKEDLITLLSQTGIKEMPEISFKENLPVIAKIVMDNTNSMDWFGLLKRSFKTSTDVLRLAAFLSDGDVSLATPTKFKSMPRKVRRLLVQLLENCNAIEEDLLRHETMWIKLGESLHIGEYKQYTKVQTAFDKLRNNRKEIETFGGKVDKAIKENRINDALRLLSKRPGELARCLDFLLRKFYSVSDMNKIVESFATVTSQVSPTVLLQVKEHFSWRNEKNDSRVFFPKGVLAKAYTIKNELGDIPQTYCNDIVRICESAIIEQFKEKEPMGKVYIDESLKNYVIPQSQRSSNSAMKIITRGSRFKLKDDAKYVRAGVRWLNELIDGRERRTDIDLSCSFLDENFGYVDHISYTHLRNEYAVHSGDLVDAKRPRGASEFLDIYIDKALEKGIRYAAFQVYGYTQTKFCDLDDMLFNWQEGIEPMESDIFDARRVQQNMNLGGNTDCEIPIVIDLKEKVVVWCDLSLTTNTSFYRCVEGNVKGLSAVVMGIVQAHKPTMFNLSVLNARARGEIVTDRNEADTIFDTNTAKPIVKIEKIIETQNEKGEIIGTRTEVEEKEKDCRIISPWDIDCWVGELL